MSADTDSPPHPRLIRALIGHDKAEQAFLDAYSSGRMHHAWMITGRDGIGKASFAYRAAKFLITNKEAEAQDEGPGLFGDMPAAPAKPSNLDPAPTGLDLNLFEQGVHPNLHVVERQWDDKKKALKKDIGVDVIRGLHGFYGLTAADGGWRVAIIDTADDLNRSASNALLKILEEPPKKSILFLLAASPGALLPTIRSRCRVTKLEPLSTQEVEAVLKSRMPGLDPALTGPLARLADGAPGRAMSLATSGGLEAYREVRDLMAELDRIAHLSLHAMADRLTGKGNENRYEAFFDMLAMWLARIIRLKATGERQPDVLDGDFEVAAARAATGGLEQLAAVWEKVAAVKRRADALNLDKRQTVFLILNDLRAAA